MSHEFIIVAVFAMGIATAAIFVTTAVFGAQPEWFIGVDLVMSVATALLGMRIIKFYLGGD